MFTPTQKTQATAAKSGHTPKRIVSLVPSQTELLHYLGLEDEVLGITKFCVHPQSWFRNKTRVGGTKSVHIDVVKSLAPDLVIGNKEENLKSEVEELSTIAPVWVTDISTLADALGMIKQAGMLLNKQEKAENLAAQIEAGFSKLAGTANIHPPSSHFQIFESPDLQIKPKVAYLIWREPYMTVAGDTFVGDMLRQCGFDNIFEQEKRYPVTTLDKIAALGCRYLFLSSEPFPFKEEHANEIRNQLPGIKVVFVDGEMFSWYGNRLLLAVQYFKELKESLNHTVD